MTENDTSSKVTYREDCLGCNDGVFHQHGESCFNCGSECNQAQQFDRSEDLTNPEIVFCCDRCVNSGAL